MKFVASILAASALFVSGSAHAATYLQQTAPATADYAYETDFGRSVFGPQFFDISGSVSAVMSGTDLSLGCSASDFSGFTAGTIALVARGTCQFTQKVQLAQEAGALGVLVADYASSSSHAMGGSSLTIVIPAFMIASTVTDVFQPLALTGALQVRMAADASAPAVPEPASWAMMIGGLALAGGAMRRRRIVPALRAA